MSRLVVIAWSITHLFLIGFSMQQLSVLQHLLHVLHLPHVLHLLRLALHYIIIYYRFTGVYYP